MDYVLCAIVLLHVFFVFNTCNMRTYNEKGMPSLRYTENA